MNMRLSIASIEVCSVVLAIALAGTAVVSQNALASETIWPQFRGPNGQGVVPIDLPTDFDSANNRVWTVDTVGAGWSSPVTANGQVWFTSAVTQEASPEELKERLAKLQLADIKTFAGSVEFHAICLDSETGERIYDIVLAKETKPEPINPLNSYASPTPVIADGKVICHFGNYGTWCLDCHSGKELWSSKQVVDHSVGPGSSPIVVDDRVILVCDGIDQQFICALRMSDGELAWKTNRPPLRTNIGEFKKAYCTPLVIDVAGTTQLVIPGAQWTVAYEPIHGNEVWRADCGDGFSTTPMPVYENGLVVISTGYTRPEFVAIRPDGSGDVTATHIIWKNNRSVPTMPSAVARDGQMYAISDSGILTLFDVTSGKEVSRKRIGGNFSASPLLSRKHLYLLSREGIITVVEANPELTVISTTDMEAPILASPAVIGNDLIIRTENQVMRITAQ